MGKLIKIFLVAVVLSLAFAYAQPVDTTAKRDSSSQVITAASTVTPSSGVKKAVTGIKTTKPPTNWSKIKDLFL